MINIDYYRNAMKVFNDIVRKSIVNDKVAVSEYIKLEEAIKIVDYNNRVYTVINNLDSIVKESYSDAEAIFDNDPSAETVEDVIAFYPGYSAILYYRIAHEFYKIGCKHFARCISEYAHSKTGIDINPGATIGKRFAIDHGTGIVIGETATIGDNVMIYQGVTLGALHLENREQVGEKRHPTIEDNVVIYANATILGGETVIGKGSIIGANTFITKSVAPNSKMKRTYNDNRN